MELVLSVIWLKVYHLMITPITHWHVILLLFLKRDGNIVLLNFLFLSMDRIIFKYKTTIVFLKEMFLLTGDPNLTLIWSNITNLVCYTYFHWFFSPECQHIFGKQTGYIFQYPKPIKTWTTKHYASLNQWYNTE
jgi:hypothetical protein